MRLKAPPGWLPTSRVAEMLGIDASTLRRWCNKGRGPDFSVTEGGERRFRFEDVEAYRIARRVERLAEVVVR